MPQWHPETLAVRSGRETSEYGEHSQSLFLSSSFTFDSAAQAEALFAGTQDGFTYSRTANPTVRAFEQRLAALEGAERAIATASGMAAIQATLLTFLQQGDHLVCSRSLFGSTMGLIGGMLPRYGIDVTFVDPTDTAAWQAACHSHTKMLFTESPSNPLGEVADIAALSKIAQAQQALLVVDNCFCSPALQQPLRLGADLSVASATKAIDGQGRVLGGVVCGSDALMEQVYLHVRTAGQIMSPFNAWVLLSGLETLFIRMEKQCAQALALAQWLQTHPQVQRVYYPGLPEHPQHALIARQQSAFGTVVAFEVKGGQTEAWRVLDAVQLFSKTANLGDVKSTITHPYTTTHGRLSADAKAQAGIAPSLLRLSIGLEYGADLQADLDAALKA